MCENEKCGRGKRHAASDKQQRKIIISNFRQISTNSENVVQPVAAGLYTSHKHRFLQKFCDFPEIVNFHNDAQVFSFSFGQRKMINANFSHFLRSSSIIVAFTTTDLMHTKHVKHVWKCKNVDATSGRRQATSSNEKSSSLIFHKLGQSCPKGERWPPGTR